MDDSPYTPPSSHASTPFGDAGTQGPSSDVVNAVQTQAMVLLVFTAVMLGLIVIRMILALVGIGFVGTAEGFADSEEGMMLLAQGTAGLVGSLIPLAGGVVIIVGCLKMKKFESYGYARTANILAMIPCVSPCCLLGIPLGIWGLVVLSRPEVQSAFRS